MINMKTKDNYLEFNNVESFSLSETFDCGQCFRWSLDEEKYIGIVRGKEVSVSLHANCLSLKFNSDYDSEETWKEYFDLDLDYKEILQGLKATHPILFEACNKYKGIRILKQEPWETLCSFIISQNNNIPRIKGIISRLCEQFGECLTDGYSFPSAHKISLLSEDDLKPIRCGFRAGYILDAARNVADGKVLPENLYSMPMQEARLSLMRIKGVGPKVAECTLLYGLHRLEAFPMDVWMKRIMDKFFPNQDSRIFGKFAGIAQQYLYHYIRSNPKLLE